MSRSGALKAVETVHRLSGGFLGMDPGENLVFGHWPEPVMTMLYHRFLHEGIIEVKFPTPPSTSGGNPRSADRMTAAFMCRYPLGGGILEDALGLEGPTVGFFGGAVFISKYSWRRFLAAWSSGGLASDVW